jgi:hypothetical protein
MPALSRPSLSLRPFLSRLRSATPLQTACILSTLAYPSVSGREPLRIEISAQATPPTMDIELRKRVTLSDNASPLPGFGHTIVQDSRGRFYATGTTREHRFLVFDSTGKFLRSVGRSGKGPGEYLDAPNLLFGSGDSLFVADKYGRRLTLLGRNFTVLDSWPSDVDRAPVRLTDGRFAQIADDGYGGNWFHTLELLDKQGRRIRRMEIGPPEIEGKFVRTWGLTVGPRGTLWTANRFPLQLEEWDTTGTLLTTLVRKIDGAELEALPERRKKELTQPICSFDRDGRLWMAWWVKDEATVRMETRNYPQGKVEVEVADYDVVLEVADMATRKLLASRRFPLRDVLWVQGGMIRSSNTLENGQKEIEIHDVRIVAPRKR